MAFTGSKAITIDKSLVVNSNQTNFPALFRTLTGVVDTSGTAVAWVSGDKFPTWFAGIQLLINGTRYTVSSVTDDSNLVLTGSAGTQTGVNYYDTPYLATTGNGGDVTDANGYDIEFYADAALTTKLKWETEIYDAVTGNVVYHVKIPTVSTSVNTTYYIAYGDAAITTDQSDPPNVWDSNYKAVYHLPNGTTLTANDSTSNANNGTLGVFGPDPSAGIIDGGALGINGNSPHIDIGSGSSLNISGIITISAWYNPSTVSKLQNIVCKGAEDYRLRLNNQDISIGSYDGSDHQTVYASSLNPGEWVYLVGIYDGTNWLLYYNGALVSTTADAIGAIPNTSQASLMSNDTGIDRFLEGILDETRISDIARSADWIATEYNNQWTPGLFYSVGSTAVTTTQTITGKARISKSVQQTTTGTARISKSVQQTTTGTARISKSVQQTTTGKARITKAVQQDITGTSRISKSVQNGITGKASILNGSAMQNITGKARIVSVAYYGSLKYYNQNIDDWVCGDLKTYIASSSSFEDKPLNRWSSDANDWLLVNSTGLCGQTNTRLKTTVGHARITAQQLRTLAGTGRISLNTSKLTTGTSRITATTLRTLTGKGRITATSSRTITGTANIASTNGTFSLAAPANVSIGIYDADDVLVRTTVVNQDYSAGVHTAYWDGLNNLGTNIIGLSTYTAKIQSHNITALWSVVGNTSYLNHGSTVMNSYSRFVNMCISGANMYVGESFNEGGARAAFKLLTTDVLTLNQQYNIDILPYATDPNHSNPNDTDLSTENVCSNGTNVFWGGNDPYAAYSSNPLGQSWVFATSVATDTNVALSAGTSIKCGIGKTYPNAIDIVANQPLNVITGMCCDANYLWVARGSQNAIYCYNATTGAAVMTITGFTNPRRLTYDSSNGGRVWFLSGTNSVIMANINSGTGNLASGSLTISDFPSGKINFGVNSSTKELAVVVGSITQQIWCYDITAANPTGTVSRKLGQAGGYQSVTLPANDRFNFEDYSTGQTKGLMDPYVCYDSNDNIYVGDVGTNRCQIFDNSHNFLKTVMMQPAVYGVSANMVDPSKAYIGAIEYDLATDGTYTLSRNFSAQLPANFFSQGYNLFRWCSTASNGKTYATLEEQGVAPANTYLFELTDSVLRDTGTYINEPSNYFNNIVTKDFKIQQIYSASYAIGQQPIIREKVITFDGSYNPIISSWSTLVTLQPIAAGDAVGESGNTAFHGISDDGIVWLKNKEITTDCLFHLEGYKLSDGTKIRQTMQPDTRAGDIAGFSGYQGWFPDPSYFERGNIVNTNTFNDMQVMGNYVSLIYNGENWKGAQTNYFNVYSSNALPIIQFGTNRITSEAIEPTGMYSSGNGFSFRMAFYDNDNMYFVNGDESVHSAMHYWRMTNLTSLSTQTISMVPPTYQTYEGVSLTGSLVFNSTQTTTGNITLSNATTSTWTVQSGVNSYSPYNADLSLALDAGSNNGATRYVDLTITPSYNPSLTSWKVFGDVSFNAFYGPENTAFQTTAELEVLDNADKIIARVGLGQLADETWQLACNSTILISTTSTNIAVNTLQVWQSFTIVTTASGCTITYGNYTPVTVGIYDVTSSWNKPTKVRVLVRDLNTFHYGNRKIATRLTRYVDYV